MKKVVVGLSGGVDSSVAAAILHQEGYQVEGLTLWLMKGKGQCCSDGMVDASSICEQLGIPHHIVDTRDLFQTNIINYLIDGYQSGVTPLPCSQCNRVVKFPPMLNYAKNQLGIDKIATGHYARVQYDPIGDRHQLLKAIDITKDQSYFLYDLTQDLLAATIFPLGNQTKTETREMAEKFNLTTAQKPESQDLCLIEAHGSMQSFLSEYINQKAGDIMDLEGNILGKHEGIHNYTIGQRKGLGVAYSEPLYVVKLDVAMNRVIVSTKDKATDNECILARMNWVSIAKPTTPLKAEVKLRYRSETTPVTIIPMENNQVKLIFDQPQFAVTPGQAGVLYNGDLVLGGGIIQK